MAKREKFSGRIGFILACIGSAIGLGNVWMFSWRLGQYGGSAFLIPYFLFLAILVPIGLMGEFAIGRKMKGGSFKAYNVILEKLPSGLRNIISTIPTLGVVGIFLFYAIVTGWIIRYFFAYVTGKMNEVSNISDYFNGFIGTSDSIIWHGIALLIVVLIVSLGVSKGIEKINKIMMPLLFIILIGIMIRSLSLEGAMEGVKYLLIPKWDMLMKPMTWIMALGQAFFTVSLNGCAMVVYGSYLDEEVDVVNATKQIIIFDTIAALLSAFVIIPAAFAFGLDPQAGPTLLFITVPSIFSSMPGGTIFGILFFAGIIFAAVSSAINMLEVPVEVLENNFNISRKKAAIGVTIIVFLLGIPLDLSMNLFGMVADISTIYISPLGAVIGAICIYWLYGTDNILPEINKGASKKQGKLFVLAAKYFFVPFSILVLVLGMLLGGIG